MIHKICIFGDSITWGSGDPNGGGWANRLKKYFETQDKNYQFYFFPLGIPGLTTNKLTTTFKNEALNRNANFIIFAIGINDTQYTSTPTNPLVTKEKFTENIETLIKASKDLQINPIFIGLTPVNENETMPLKWHPEKRYHQNSIIKEYDQIIDNLTSKSNLEFIEIFKKLSNSDLTEDGLHPNSKGHQKIFKLILNRLIKNKHLPEPKQ